MRKCLHSTLKWIAVCFAIAAILAMSACSAAPAETNPTVTAEATQPARPELTEEWAWTLVETDAFRDCLAYVFADRVLTEDGWYEWVQDGAYFLDSFGDNGITCYKSAKVTTVQDLQNALSEFYCQSIIDAYFMQVAFEEPDGKDGEMLAIYEGLWFEAEGTIYFAPQYGKGGMTPIRETMTIEKLEDGIYRISNEFDYSGGDRNYYTVIYDNGGYKIKDITGTYAPEL